MANVTSLRHVSLGAYLPADSFVHRLDGRSKLVGAALLLAAILALPADWATAAALAVLLALTALARLPLRHLAAILRPLLPMLAILAALQLAFGAAPASAEGAAGWPARLVAVLWGLLRLVDLMLLVGLLTSTTTEGALSTAMERLLAPLDAVKLPGSELAMVAGIALRFMPILGEEMESISAAHAARDVTARRTSRWRLAENALRSARLIVPLFVDVFRRIDEMTLAMMARCYGPLPGVRRRRTHLLAASLRTADYVALIVAAAALGLAVWA
jgi:energy-coupling factor transport system permease protein